AVTVMSLAAGCGNTSLSLEALDLSPIPDLAGADFAAADFATPFTEDLSFVQPVYDLSALDFANCIPVAENCFNGVDDDCDGLADCADPSDCSSIAACVPELAGASYGTYIDKTSTCPQAGAGSQLLYGIPVGPYTCFGCSLALGGTLSLPVYSDNLA